MIAAAMAGFGLVVERAVAADQNTRISGPVVHENLAVYLVHGTSAPGPVPLTLQEALGKGSVQVIETGSVNELQIENTGLEEVFIQAGDIVKGGKQDRVLTVSFLLPPLSGRLPIASFCVEQGRWTARGVEDVKKFSSALEAMPSHTALLAMASPPAAKPAPIESGSAAQRVVRHADETAEKQRKVWDSVAATQKKLSGGLNAAVAAPQSATSLQLSLENKKLKEARAGYMNALETAGSKDRDVIGYVVAINGKITSANVYPSNALFKKMWAKQLAASVTEAIGEKREGTAIGAPAAPKVVQEFLNAAEKGTVHERPVAAGMRQETRDNDASLYSEARSADGRWVHRSYLAK